jgi:hypothetical protein
MPNNPRLLISFLFVGPSSFETSIDPLLAYLFIPFYHGPRKKMSEVYYNYVKSKILFRTDLSQITFSQVGSLYVFDKNLSELRSLAVAPENMGKGVGKKLNTYPACSPIT